LWQGDDKLLLKMEHVTNFCREDYHATKRYTWTDHLEGKKESYDIVNYTSYINWDQHEGNY
jgi:hypothetical protein